MNTANPQGVLGGDTDPTPGILGDGSLHPGKYNMALARRAIKAGWPISDEVKKLVVDQMAEVVGSSDDERNRIGAARVLVAADGVNARREAADSPHLHLHGVLSDGRRPEELSDAELFERIRAIEDNPIYRASITEEHQPAETQHDTAGEPVQIEEDPEPCLPVKRYCSPGPLLD